jgi:uncharacterized protein YfdQ (DUF2303 family)
MKNEAETIAELASKAAGVATSVKASSGREYLVVPAGFSHVEVTLPNTLSVNTPKLISQKVTLQNADALVEYLNRFKSADSLLLADVAASRIVGALDYHAVDKAALVVHTATLDLPFSEEWKIWTAISGQMKQQLEFARFIEENAPDIKAPDAGSLLEAVRDLQARRNVSFIKAVRTETDNESFEFNDNTEARTKGDLELPTKFLLNIPVYFGDPPTEVYAFLRWKLDDGALTLGIKLHRAEHIRQAAFKLIMTGAVERTGVMAVFGKLG